MCDVAINSSCTSLGCSSRKLISRRRIEDIATIFAQSTVTDDQAFTNAILPKIHLGGVASGNMVMKSATERDSVALQEAVIAFEMEGAGVWDTFK